MWNTVVGRNDTLPHIENTLWIEGSPKPIGLVTIAKDLTTVTFDDGNALRFREEAERATTIDFFPSTLGLPTALRHLRERSSPDSSRIDKLHFLEFSIRVDWDEAQRGLHRLLADRVLTSAAKMSLKRRWFAPSRQNHQPNMSWPNRIWIGRPAAPAYGDARRTPVMYANGLDSYTMHVDDAESAPTIESIDNELGCWAAGRVA